MFSKKSFSCLLLVLLLIASATFAVSAQSNQRIVVSTGGTGGVYYPLGGAMADIWSDKVDGVLASSASSGASVENVNLLHHGEVQLALIQNDIAYYA
ncbi:MAG: TAXI family TRAP transporter solute-binding subunit, partial [Atribacterota bacterium]|nr:TAXI family TRAP transporter solute-binding subunit [Atribacterota bacterium]